MARRCLRGLPSTSPSREMPNQPDSKAVGRHVKEHLLTGSLLGWDMRATTAQNGLARSPKTRLKSTMNLVLPERSRAPSLKPTNYRLGTFAQWVGVTELVARSGYGPHGLIRA